MPDQPWVSAQRIVASVSAASREGARLAPGKAVYLRLHHDPDVAYLTLPRGAGEVASFGGMAGFVVETGGTYQVGVDEPVWVDVVHDGKAAEPISFGRTAECSGMRKQVTFELAPGEYVLELSGNLDDEVGVVVTRL
ncbi:MAG: hypothetical protein IE933_15330 [Sphingomonadales bacterium]|nr:hypothetical protein [Sphingomonadales bacterium]MBD3775364.1 hypothetical protein [Paracoccaceae bacterium]